MHDMAERIEELAAKKLDMRIGVGRELKKLPGLLLDAEDVLNLARGAYDGKQGLVVVTDRRVMFVEEGVVRSRLEDFPYNRVSSIQSEKSIMSGKLIVFASGNKAEIKNVMPKARATEIGDYVRAEDRGQAAERRSGQRHGERRLRRSLRDAAQARRASRRWCPHGRGVRGQEDRPHGPHLRRGLCST